MCDKILDTVRVTKCWTFRTSQVDYRVVAANAQRPKIVKPDNFLAIYIGESLFCLRQIEKISKIICDACGLIFHSKEYLKIIGLNYCTPLFPISVLLDNCIVCVSLFIRKII